MTPASPPVDAVLPRRRRSWRRLATVGLVVALAVLATADLALYVGPTRSAIYRGKRVAPGRDYRVSYAYADGTRLASDTDHVGERYFFAAHPDAKLTVRTYGVGTLRVARLAGTNPAATAWAAGRWAAVAAGVGVLAAVGRRRRIAPAVTGPAPGSLAAPT